VGTRPELATPPVDEQMMARSCRLRWVLFFRSPPPVLASAVARTTAAGARARVRENLMVPYSLFDSVCGVWFCRSVCSFAFELSVPIIARNDLELNVRMQEGYRTEQRLRPRSIIDSRDGPRLGEVLRNVLLLLPVTGPHQHRHVGHCLTATSASGCAKF